jgi:NTP pyrophosphatase (non-canonical NTP hydrolase)
MTKIQTIKSAQQLVKKFAAQNGWKDEPNIDKFDHLHEELLEMSRYLRYKDKKARLKSLKEHREIFLDGIGDLFFGTCRLANQLGIDLEDAFNFVKDNIMKKYSGRCEKKKDV